jgi:hypothetical protein
MAHSDEELSKVSCSWLSHVKRKWKFGNHLIFNGNVARMGEMRNAYKVLVEKMKR